MLDCPASASACREEQTASTFSGPAVARVTTSIVAEDVGQTKRTTILMHNAMVGPVAGCAGRIFLNSRSFLFCPSDLRRGTDDAITGCRVHHE